MTRNVDVVVVGAGFAGLGAAAALRRRGVRDFAVLERGDGPGHFWTRQYDRLRLQTAYHAMPDDQGLARLYPRYKTRDQVVGYLREYTALHRLTPHLELGTHVIDVRRDARGGARWRIETSREVLRSRYVVMATSALRVPREISLAGAASFRGLLLHSAEYRNPLRFEGRRVLVLGSGNSATEIATDLAEGGAGSVSLWVRAPRLVIDPRRLDATLSALVMTRLVRLPGFEEAHRLTAGTARFERLTRTLDAIEACASYDLARWNIPRPTLRQIRKDYRAGRVPVLDVGAVELIRRGTLRVIDGNRSSIEHLTPDGVRFPDREEPFDAVVLATGYRHALEEILGDDELLGSVPWRSWRGPLTDGRSRSTVEPSMFFPGFDPGLYGGKQIGWWGWEAGQIVADELLAR